MHPEWNGSIDDEELIECMLKSKPSAETIFGDKISIGALWEGNEQALAKAFPDDKRNHDASLADAALAQRLAFWAGNEAERMKRLMLRSGLNRDKWRDREDYLPRTILNACEKQTIFWKREPSPTPVNNNQPNHDSEWEEVSISDVISRPEPPQRFRIEFIVPVGVLTLLAANGGAGKSMLALLAAVCVAMGLPFMGKKVERGRVVFYSAEDAKGVIRRRLMRICKYLSVNPSSLAENLKIYDRTGNPVLFHEVNIGGVKKGAPTDEYKTLHTYIKRHRADLVIIDNASDTFEANENERIRVREFIRSLVQLVEDTNGSVLLLAHVDKQTAKGMESSESFSGSTQWHNSCRSRLFLTSKDNVLTLYHQKSNHGELSAPTTMAWSPDGILIHIPDNEPSQDQTAIICVLSLIYKNYKGGTFISPEPNARTNAWCTLRYEADFPKSVKASSQLQALLRNAKEAGLLECEPYIVHRKERPRWKLTENGIARITTAETKIRAPDTDSRQLDLIATLGA